MEPSDEPILRVNRAQTALVLGGNASSAVPPDLLIAGSEGFAPLQEETVKRLASILTPAICPSTLSSKFRVSILLYGLAGMLYAFHFCLLLFLLVGFLVEKLTNRFADMFPPSCPFKL